MRQIDADALRVQVEYSRKDNPYTGAPFGSLSAVYDIAHRHILKIIDDTPTVDAEPVVRCKDCIHRDSPNCPMYFEDEGWCEHCGGGFPAADRTEDDGFCHLGKHFEE